MDGGAWERRQPRAGWNPGTVTGFDGVHCRGTQICREHGNGESAARIKITTGIYSGIQYGGTQVTRSGTTGTGYQGSAHQTWEW